MKRPWEQFLEAAEDETEGGGSETEQPPSSSSGNSAELPDFGAIIDDKLKPVRDRLEEVASFNERRSSSRDRRIQYKRRKREAKISAEPERRESAEKGSRLKVFRKG